MARLICGLFLDSHLLNLIRNPGGLHWLFFFSPLPNLTPYSIFPVYRDAGALGGAGAERQGAGQAAVSGFRHPDACAEESGGQPVGLQGHRCLRHHLLRSGAGGYARRALQ